MKVKSLKSNNIQNIKHGGFSLVEMLVAIFIFSLIITTSIVVFAKLTSVNKQAKAIQQDIEDARYAMEIMAKTIRTSSREGCSGCGYEPRTRIRVYDYSQLKCIVYEFYNHSLWYASASVGIADIAKCNPSDYPFNCTAGECTKMVNGYISNGYFSIKESDQNSIGRGTISIGVCSDSSCSDRANLQTTVSLRDYQKISQ